MKCSSVVVGTDYNTKKRRIWAQGRLDTLAELKEKERATAIMINVDVLSPLQQVFILHFPSSIIYFIFHSLLFDSVMNGEFSILLYLFPILEL